MESIESLNTALGQVHGTLVFVSHDRAFVSSLRHAHHRIKRPANPGLLQR